MKPLGHGDAVLCSDGGIGYKDRATARSLERFVVGSKPGTRVAATCHHIPSMNSHIQLTGQWVLYNEREGHVASRAKQVAVLSVCHAPRVTAGRNLPEGAV